ncbi:hypothetical protein TOK_5243 [Pseudonocardia sp. N23]|nr:hypothetical protein TOK_5243 [Pseudonocardia sp. N23]
MRSRGLLGRHGPRGGAVRPAGPAVGSPSGRLSDGLPVADGDLRVRPARPSLPATTPRGPQRRTCDAATPAVNVLVSDPARPPSWPCAATR